MNPLINLHLNRTLGERRKWHQNVMNLLLGKSMCGSCLRLDSDLIQWDVNFVLQLDGSEVECTLKNIMIFTFGSNVSIFKTYDVGRRRIFYRSFVQVLTCC